MIYLRVFQTDESPARYGVLVNGFQYGGNYDRSGAGDLDFDSMQAARDYAKQVAHNYRTNGYTTQHLPYCG